MPSFTGRFVIAVAARLPDNLPNICQKPVAMTQTLFFAHANGFPSATYGKLFAALAPEYQVRHLPQHGHDPRFPVNDNWSNLVDELIHHLEQHDEPVWGVGHSLGGVLHYHAALLRPELYRGVAMLDSPVLTLADKVVIRAAKRFGFIDRITPAGRTLGRREVFVDLAASILNALKPMCSTVCNRRAKACACVSMRPPRSAFIVACRTPVRAVRSSCRCRWPWYVAVIAGWCCRITLIWCGGCRAANT